MKRRLQRQEMYLLALALTVLVGLVVVALLMSGSPARPEPIDVPGAGG